MSTAAHEIPYQPDNSTGLMVKLRQLEERNAMLEERVAMLTTELARSEERNAMLEGENSRLASDNFQLRRAQGLNVDPDKRSTEASYWTSNSEGNEAETARLAQKSRELLRYKLVRQAVDTIPSKKLSPAGKLAAAATLETVSRWNEEGLEGPQPFNASTLSAQIGVPERTARAAMNELEDIGVIRIDRKDNGVRGPGHRDYWQVEPTEKLLHQNPKKWIERPRRNPNGKGCDCGVPTVETIHAKRQTIRKTGIRHDTVCPNCGRIHKTRNIPVGKPEKLSKPETIDGPITVETMPEAKAEIRAMKKRVRTPKKHGVTGPATSEPRRNYKSGQDLPRENYQDWIRNSGQTVNTERSESSSVFTVSCPTCKRPADALPTGGYVCEPCGRMVPGGCDG